MDVLSGKAPKGRKDEGALVCSCFGIRINTIIEAIESRGLTTVDQIGAVLEAGTNCGSCRADLGALLGLYGTEEETPAGAG